MQLGKYEILEELGQGGFGVVYKAKDLTLDRLVALKVLHPQLTVDPRFIENFRKEARLMAKITHPNVVRVYEIDEFEGRAFIVMEYLPGGNLEEKIAAEGQIPFEEALEITRQISKALEAGYKKNLIHRDVKPANILFDEDGNALLGDFGVAHTVQVSSMGTMTQGGVGVGTPSYRPPELWNGTPPPSQATDQYSLACVFYEMLSGDKLFGGETTEQIIVKMLIQEPDLDKLESEEVKTILKKALSKNPADRYGSLDIFVQSLIASNSLNVEKSEPTIEVLDFEVSENIQENSDYIQENSENEQIELTKDPPKNLTVVLDQYDEVPQKIENQKDKERQEKLSDRISSNDSTNSNPIDAVWGLSPSPILNIREMVDDIDGTEEGAVQYAEELFNLAESEEAGVDLHQLVEMVQPLIEQYPDSENLAYLYAGLLGFKFDVLENSEEKVRIVEEYEALSLRFPENQEIQSLKTNAKNIIENEEEDFDLGDVVRKEVPKLIILWVAIVIIVILILWLVSSRHYW